MKKDAIPCRVCGQLADYFFTKRILCNDEASYFKCTGCGQVQTEEVSWVAEAYANLTFQRVVGMADRCISTALQADRPKTSRTNCPGTRVVTTLCGRRRTAIAPAD
jgi:hypothetical protein